jgi:hypothetical protein
MGVLLDQSKSGLTLNEVVNVPYVQRKDGTATPTPTPTDPDTLQRALTAARHNMEVE